LPIILDDQENKYMLNSANVPQGLGPWIKKKKKSSEDAINWKEEY
jgi:hypothetical protein